MGRREMPGGALLDERVAEAVGALVLHAGIAAAYVFSFTHAHARGFLSWRSPQYLTIWMVALNTAYFAAAALRDALLARTLWRHSSAHPRRPPRNRHAQLRASKHAAGGSGSGPASGAASGSEITGAASGSGSGSGSGSAVLGAAGIGAALDAGLEAWLGAVMAVSVGACGVFWALVAVDEELVLPRAVGYPPLLNHLQHTLPLATALLEPLLLAPPRPPHRATPLAADLRRTLAILLAYFALHAARLLLLPHPVLLPYPFMHGWGLPHLAAFALPCALLALFLACALRPIRTFASR